MGHPLELAVHLARGGENGNLAHARRQSGLEPQIAVDGGEMRGRAGTVELHARRALQPGDSGARHRPAVVRPLAGLIQILAPGSGRRKP
jgi:hypothetical protein